MAQSESTLQDAQDPLISVENVTYTYPHAAPHVPVTPALNRLTLSIRRGEYVAILGHNGSGKSTLARMLNGLLVPDTGRVLVEGQDTHDQRALPAIRALVGMIFSDPENQIIATTVEDDIGWGLAARGVPRDEVTRRVDAVIRATGLSSLRTATPNALSGGQKQRLAIAGILALEPDCIVADEPTALLDPQTRRDVIRLLHALHRDRGLTVIHITHLLEEAAEADRIVILDRGTIRWDATPAVVFANLDPLRELRLVIPELFELGHRLRALGVPLPTDAVTPDAIVSWLERRP
jgi:energy-coupling factor transport system ATP-binding protein